MSGRSFLLGWSHLLLAVRFFEPTNYIHRAMSAYLHNHFNTFVFNKVQDRNTSLLKKQINF